MPPFEMRDMNNAQSEGLGNEPWSVAVGDNGQEFGDTEKKAGGGATHAAPTAAVEKHRFEAEFRKGLRGCLGPKTPQPQPQQPLPRKRLFVRETVPKTCL